MGRVGLDMTVVALVNDTVGTLALGHYHDDDTVAAIIIGTGTNACYVERTDAITKCQGLLSNSGSMGFEKMISGMYLGDIVRRVILRMAQESDLFAGVDSRLNMAFSLRTPLMSAMHEDDSPDLREVARIMKECLGVSDIPLKIRRLIVRVCDIVTQRAARLAAAGIVGILRKIGRDGSGGVGSRMKGEGYSRTRRSVVSVEGGLYESYSTFREYMHSAVAELLGEDVSQHVVLRLSEDGSGLGAALLAAAHAPSLC
ncbi:Hexokinase-4 [Nymphaea thermarum]|nr:Hexokinase-4 [Nymphaea thermarum]